MVPLIVPRDIGSIRNGHLAEKTFEGLEAEALLERAEQIPDSPAEILASLDAQAQESRVRSELQQWLRDLGELELVPTFWDATTNFVLYFQYGYEAFLGAIALYPEAVERIWWEDAIKARFRNEILARLYRELDLLPLLFCGHDICVNAGPMCSPTYLHEHYWPHVRTSVEPLLEAGVRLICHRDGNVMPLIDDELDAGFTGFQGFQHECGVDLRDIRARLSRRVKHPLLLTGLSVTCTLPHGHEQDVRDEVDFYLNVTEGGRGMFLFTSNVTGVEVPPVNLAAAYAHLRQRRCGEIPTGSSETWPWGSKPQR